MVMHSALQIKIAYVSICCILLSDPAGSPERVVFGALVCRYTGRDYGRRDFRKIKDDPPLSKGYPQRG